MSEPFDVEQALKDGGDLELLRIWDLPAERRIQEGLLAASRETGSADDVAAAEDAWAELPEVTALQSLRANAKLVSVLTAQRWYVMQFAREEGASWSEIGAALGISKQAAHHFYRRKIEWQQHYADNLARSGGTH